MRKLLKTYLLIITLSFISCITTKTTDTKNEKDMTKQLTDDKTMMEKGFSKGTITSSKSKNCPYTLTVDKYSDILDPINLHDFFKADIPQNVWVKYSDLRMNSRCTHARPVSITAINKRLD